MKKLSILFLLIAGLAVTLSSCEEDDPSGETLEPPTAEAVNSNVSQLPGETAVVSVAFFADAGIKSIAATPAGGEETDLTGSHRGKTSAVVSYNFDIPESAEEGDVFEVVFTVADESDRTANATVTITVGEPQAQTIEINPSSEGVGTTTWQSGNTYILNGKIYVNDGQTLTIEPGTVIKGQAGQAEDASALIVARGGKIMANGTSDNPIIFTTIGDDVTRTNDINVNTRGQWGGVILLGNAYINHANGETNIEGIPADEDPRSLYGVGSGWERDDNHSAGEMSYVSIRHGGTNIGAGNEINGLTMGGVGRGTVLHHIEVFGNDDDGFEWFGGTANTSYLASIYNQDDSYDMDFGWRGENQFWLAFQEPGFDDSNRGFESDGAHSGNYTAEIFSQPRIYNITIIGSGNETPDNNAMYVTEGFGAFVNNSIFMNFGQGVNITTDGATDMTSRDRLADGDLVFQNNIFFNIGDGSMAALSNGLAELETHLTENDNEIADPGLGAVDEDGFNPLPSAGSLALTKDRAAVPAGEVNGFTYEDADFIGAFGDENWLEGWTAADAYGLLK